MQGHKGDVCCDCLIGKDCQKSYAWKGCCVGYGQGSMNFGEANEVAVIKMKSE